MPAGIQVYRDQDEWHAWQKRGDAVLHIDLAKWADVMLIAPLDANSLAKISQVKRFVSTPPSIQRVYIDCFFVAYLQGICDNLLLCTVRAWDVARPMLFCPAMNTRMWEHPITAPQIEILKSWGYQEISCISKTLMCGDTGLGGMALPDNIVSCVIRCLQPRFLK